MGKGREWVGVQQDDLFCVDLIGCSALKYPMGITRETRVASSEKDRDRAGFQCVRARVLLYGKRDWTRCVFDYANVHWEGTYFISSSLRYSSCVLICYSLSSVGVGVGVHSVYGKPDMPNTCSMTAFVENTDILSTLACHTMCVV